VKPDDLWCRKKVKIKLKFLERKPHQLFSMQILYPGVLNTKTPKSPKTLKTPKTLKLENKDSPYFGGLRNYDQPVANATES